MARKPILRRYGTAAREAESAGYDAIWLGDSVTVLERARGDCFTLMAAPALAAQRVAIGTVPLLMSLRQPVPLAHALATINVMAQGGADRREPRPHVKGRLNRGLLHA